MNTYRRISKRVAIIGAGCSGLTAIKCCLDEGLTPVCYERADELGGLWNYTDQSYPGNGSVYKSCTINTSKEMMAFSDFPVPAHYPSFLPHHLVLEYFMLYATKFGLLDYINFGTSVENISPTKDFDLTGKWEVKIRRSEDTQDEVVVEVFDAVMVCTGHHVYPHTPDMPGLKQFQGKLMHSHEYKTPQDLTGKNVLIVGKLDFTS